MRREIAENLKLPKDLALGAVTVTVSGRSEVTVENYKGILEYTSKKIVVQTKGCQVDVLGEDLLISYYTADEMKISGQISEIIYC